MFRAGDIVIGPFPANEAGCNVGAHYLVVLGQTEEGVMAMFTTSLKEATGGRFEFTADERQAARFAKPCRFAPDSLALFTGASIHQLKPTGGRLTQKMMTRLITAAVQAKATYKRFDSSLRLVA